jgi:undecaprenyl-diphosphatase
MTGALNYFFELDQEFFLWLNGFHTPFWDTVMEIITNKFTWIPMYVILLYGIIKRFGKTSIGIILSILVAVALADFVASGLLKPYFMRTRPCYDPVIGSLVHLVGGCGGAYGFVSSHASTSFAIVSSVILLPSKNLRGVQWLWLWAVIYTYSRVYVGVHYPLDILGGAFIGILTGLLCSFTYHKIAPRLFPG